MAREKPQADDTAGAATPEHHLAVIHPFDLYKRGDVITDPVLIDAIKAGPNIHHCHKIKPQ